MTALLRGLLLGDPAAATGTSSSRLSAEVKQVKWPPLPPDDDDKVTDEWTGASDVNDDEEDELPQDAVDVMVDVAADDAISADRKETERRGDAIVARLTPERPDVDPIFVHSIDI